MKISEVIVVEGKNDIMAVKRAVNADVISTSGSGISKNLIEMLKKLNVERGIIVLMDPDGPGEKIRAIISEQIPTAKHAFIVKSKARVENDIGIEHADKEAIVESLKNLINFQEFNSDLIYQDLINYKLANFENSKENREELCEFLNITYCNAKTLLKRLKMLNINKEKLALIMEEIYE